MAIVGNMYALSQLVTYSLLFIISFFVCVPAGVNVSDFRGHCLLYAKGQWQLAPPASRTLMNMDWGHDSSCNFTIFIGVVSMVISLFYVVWTAIILGREVVSTWLDSFVCLLVNSIMCVCCFSTSLTVSIGFQDWCDLVTNPLSGISRCEDGQDVRLFANPDIHSRQYFVQWQVVQFGIWSSWLCWLLLSVMSLTRIYSFSRREAFLTSINRERQRLLQRVSTETT